MAAYFPEKYAAEGEEKGGLVRLNNRETACAVSWDKAGGGAFGGPAKKWSRFVMRVQGLELLHEFVALGLRFSGSCTSQTGERSR